MCVFLARIQFSKAFRLVRGIRFDWKLSHFRLALVCCQDNFEKFNFPPGSKRFGWVYVSVFAINVATSCWRAGENCLSAAILGQGANVKKNKNINKSKPGINYKNKPCQAMAIKKHGLGGFSSRAFPFFSKNGNGILHKMQFMLMKLKLRERNIHFCWAAHTPLM